MKKPIPAIAACWALLLIGCRSIPPSEAYGLRRVELRASQTISRDRVPAELMWEGRTIRGHATLSGDGSIDHLKKSYRFDPHRADERMELGSIKLAAQVQDSSFLRTLLGAHVLRAGVGDHPKVEPISLFLNGEFQGLYLRIERIDQSYFLRRGRNPERLYKSKPRRAIFDGAMVIAPESGFDSKLGGFHASELRRIALWAEGGGPLPPLRLREALRYFVVQIFLGNCDGLINNLYLVRERGDPRLSFVPWDWERSYDGTCSAEGLFEGNRLVARLLDRGVLAEEGSALFASLIQDEFGPARVRKVLEAEVARIDEAYRADPFLGRSGHDPRAELEGLLRVQENWIAALGRVLAIRYPGFR